MFFIFSAKHIKIKYILTHLYKYFVNLTITSLLYKYWPSNVLLLNIPFPQCNKIVIVTLNSAHLHLMYIGDMLRPKLVGNNCAPISGGKWHILTLECSKSGAGGMKVSRYLWWDQTLDNKYLVFGFSFVSFSPVSPADAITTNAVFNYHTRIMGQ